MSAHRAAPLIAATATAAVALSGCGASTVAGHPRAATATSVAASTPAAAPTDAAGLATALRAGAVSIHTAHATVQMTAPGLSVSGGGDETLSAGVAQALDVTETISPIGDLRLIVVGDATYAKLPAQLNPTRKPWVLVSDTSTNPVIKAMASTLQSLRQSMSLQSTATLAEATTNLIVVGTETVAGSAATHYRFDVDVAKLPETMPIKQQMLQAGLGTVPVQLWVDSQGRPVKLTEDLVISDQHVSTVVAMGNFDAPVHITAPPADQVGTD